jgi:hypothetical protein
MSRADDPSVVEQTMEKWLEGWSGLRLYIRQRRAGAPSDETMETLLAELLRLRLGDNGDPKAVMNHLLLG